MPWNIFKSSFTLFAIVGTISLFSFTSNVSAGRLPDIYWNSTNPMFQASVGFRSDEPSNVINVNSNKQNPFDYDQVNLICPYYTKGGTRTDEPETYIIYNVSKEEYDSCRVTSSNARIIAVCDKPHQQMYFTITFRSFTPQPGGLEFHPGKDYYFISTSTGNAKGLDRKFGGRCSTHHMKLTFRVCCGDQNNKKLSDTSSSEITQSDFKTKTIGTSSSEEHNDSSKLATAIGNAGHLSPSFGTNKAIASPSIPSSPLPTLLDSFDSNAAGNPIASSSASSASSTNGQLPTRPLTRLLANSANSVASSASSSASAASRLSVGNAIGAVNSINSQANGNNLIGGSLSPTNLPNTPYWWRPHLSKLPTLKQQQQRDQQQQNAQQSGSNSLLRPAYAGQALDISNTVRDSSSLFGGLHSSSLDSQTLGQGLPTIRTQDASFPTSNLNGSSKTLPPKTGAWLLVVGGLVAVIVAFLIVCSLFACTNYLFFPPKRKSTASTSGSSGTATLPLSGLRSQLINTPNGQSPFLTHQYQMQTHLQYTQPHYEYPLQHTIIK